MTGLLAQLSLAVLVAAVITGAEAGRRLRYYRTERAAERQRWADSEPGFAAALAAKRAEPPKEPKPTLPPGIGLPVS